MATGPLGPPLVLSWYLRGTVGWGGMAFFGVFLSPSCHKSERGGGRWGLLRPCPRGQSPSRCVAVRPTAHRQHPLLKTT